MSKEKGNTHNTDINFLFVCSSYGANAREILGPRGKLVRLWVEKKAVPPAYPASVSSAAPATALSLSVELLPSAVQPRVVELVKVNKNNLWMLIIVFKFCRVCRSKQSGLSSFNRTSTVLTPIWTCASIGCCFPAT